MFGDVLLVGIMLIFGICAVWCEGWLLLLCDSVCMLGWIVSSCCVYWMFCVVGVVI